MLITVISQVNDATDRTIVIASRRFVARFGTRSRRATRHHSMVAVVGKLNDMVCSWGHAAC